MSGLFGPVFEGGDEPLDESLEAAVDVGRECEAAGCVEGDEAVQG